MKKLKLWIGLGVLVLAVGAVTWLTRTPEKSPQSAGSSYETGETVRVQMPAKSFTLKDSDGKAHSLSDYKGEVVLLHFWATWCAPCVEEIPALLEFARKLEGKRFKIFLVGMDESWEVAWQVLPKSLPPNIVSLIDVDSKVPELYGSYQFPESYLIDRAQQIVIKWVGMQKWGEPYFKESVEDLLK